MLNAWLTEKDLPGKNKDSRMFIFLSINSLSTETLKSGLLWIGLAATWTWTIFARSLRYQSSPCQACCPGWADKHRRKRQLLSRGTCIQVHRNSPVHVSAPFPQGIVSPQGSWSQALWQVLWDWYPCVMAAWEAVAERQRYTDPCGAQLKVENWGFYWLCTTSWQANNFSFLD